MRLSPGRDPQRSRMVKHDAVAEIKSCCAQRLMHVRIVIARLQLLSSVSIRFLVRTSETNEKVNE